MSCEPSTQFLALSEYHSQNWLDLSFDWLPWQSFSYWILVITLLPSENLSTSYHSMRYWHQTTGLDCAINSILINFNRSKPLTQPCQLSLLSCFSDGKLNWQNMKMEVFFCQFDILTSLFWWLFWHLQIITNIDISYSLGFCTLHLQLHTPLGLNNKKYVLLLRKLSI